MAVSRYLPDKIFEMCHEELIDEIERLRRQNHSLRTIICELRGSAPSRDLKNAKVIELWRNG